MILDYTKPLTTHLQECTIDVAQVKNCIKQLHYDIISLRENVKDKHNEWYDKALEIAAKFSILETISRVYSTQIYRQNLPEETTEIYYRRTITCQFLEHMETELNTRFINNTELFMMDFV